MTLCDFRKKEYYRIEHGEDIVLITILEKSTSNYSVFFNESAKQKFLQSVISSTDSVRREVLYPIDVYADMLAVNSSYDDFYTRPDYMKDYIISPFSFDGNFKIMLDNINNSKVGNSKEDIKQFVRDRFLINMITDALLEFVMKNSSCKKEKSKDSILESYLDLITDSIFAYNQLSIKTL